MLPEFPKARAEMLKVSRKEIFTGIWEVSPILRQIQVRPQTEGGDASYQREDGKVVKMEFNLRRVERAVNTEDARGLSPEEFFEFYLSVGRELGNMMMADLLNGIDQAVTEVGNIINIDGEGLTFEKYLEMCDKISTDFDSHGRPRPKTLLLTPEMLFKFERDVTEWTKDPIKCAALDAVLQRHRNKYDEIEAGRRLVD